MRWRSLASGRLVRSVRRSPGWLAASASSTGAVIARCPKPWLEMSTKRCKSAVLENRFALLDKGRHAFLLILDRESSVEDAALEEQALVEAGLEGAIDRLLDHHHHRQRVASNGLRRLQGFIEQLLGRDDAGDQTGFLGFERIHPAGGQAHVHRLGLANGARQALRAAGPG